MEETLHLDIFRVNEENSACIGVVLSRDSFLPLLFSETDAFYSGGRIVRYVVRYLYRSVLRRVGCQYDAGGGYAGGCCVSGGVYQRGDGGGG